MSIHKHVSYEIVEGDNSFDVEFEPVEGSETIRIEGDKATVGYLSPDEWDQGWYFEEYEEGEFYGRDNRSVGFNREARDNPQEFLDELERENPGRVFVIDKYEHGNVLYFRHATRSVPDEQWDCSHGAAFYVAPDDCPDPAAYCDSTMETYTDWCNGNIYGVVTQKFTRKSAVDDWEPGPSDECWGFIGNDHAEASLKQAMED